MKHVHLHKKKNKKKKKGRRYKAEIKSLALSIFYISGSAYSIIAKLFDLPSKPTLARWLHGMEVHPGINQQMLAALKLNVYKMNKNARKCILCMEEMSLKSNVFYDTKSDKLFGLEDIGTERNSLLATSALVVMARGVFSKWEQPIAFYFVNNSCNSLSLQGIIASVIGHIEKIELNVLGMVSDMGSNFLKLASLLGVCEQCPYFTLNENQYFCMFDVPHLLKATRNNLLKYDIGFVSRRKSFTA